MILYHGTNLKSAQAIYKNQTVDVSVGSTSVDFGPGFYTTNDLKTAEKWAIRKGLTRHDKSAVLLLDFDYEKAEPFIEFFSDDLRWGRFLVNNRNGLKYISNVAFKEHNLDRRYHITYGRIADYELITIAEDLYKNAQMLQSIDKIWNKKFSMQYVFHTKFALQFLDNIRYTVL